LAPNETLLKVDFPNRPAAVSNPSVDQLFDSGGKFTESSIRLWPALLAAGGVLLNLG